MLIKIIPVVSSFLFGSANAVRVRLIGDDLTGSAVFFWELGRIVPAVPAVPATETAAEVPAVAEHFTSSGSGGNATLGGADYLGWSGANDELPALLLPQIGLSPEIVNPEPAE
jgi:hypothetical protein